TVTLILSQSHLISLCRLLRAALFPYTTLFRSVRRDERGHVIADEWQDTNVEGVHAVGDVTGRLALTPVAVAAGRHLADRLFGGKDRKSTRLNSSHVKISYAVFCLKKKKQ